MFLYNKTNKRKKCDGMHSLSLVSLHVTGTPEAVSKFRSDAEKTGTFSLVSLLPQPTEDQIHMQQWHKEHWRPELDARHVHIKADDSGCLYRFTTTFQAFHVAIQVMLKGYEDVNIVLDYVTSEFLGEPDDEEEAVSSIAGRAVMRHGQLDMSEMFGLSDQEKVYLQIVNSILKDV